MNTCSCLKNDFNILISNQTCDRMVYEDVSIWMNETGYVIPDSYSVSITIPESNTEVELELSPTKKNIITSQELSKTSCFKDGIYCFKTVSCDVPYSTARAFLCNASCKISESKLKAKTDKDWEVIYKLEDYKQSAEESAELGMIDKSKEFIQLLEDELQKLDCCIK